MIHFLILINKVKVIILKLIGIFAKNFKARL